MPKKETIELDGGYAVLEYAAEDDVSISVYTDWDPYVPCDGCAGFSNRGEALVSIDEIGDGETQTPREKLHSYREALRWNCERFGVPIPPPAQRIDV